LEKEFKMKFTTDGKALGKSIDAWAKRKSAVVNDLHTLVVSVVCHCISTGYIDYVNKLDDAVSDGTDDKGKSVSGINLYSFRKYVEAKAPVTWQAGDKKAGTSGKFVYSKSKAETMRPAYDANPDGFRDELMGTKFWHVVKAPDPFEGFDLFKYFNAGIARYKKYMADPTKASKVTGDAALAVRVENMVAQAAKAAADPVADAKAVKAKATKPKTNGTKAKVKKAKPTEAPSVLQ
jgi:hypothetical protein